MGRKFTLFLMVAIFAAVALTFLKTNLMSFYEWTLEDPLFWSPDLNVPQLEESIDVLDREHELLLKEMGRDTHLYPVSFLELFGQTAAATEKFLQNPSHKLAWELIEKQKLAASAYEREAKALLAATGNEEITVFSPFTQVKKSIIREDLSRVIANARALKTEIEKREACLRGTGKCIRPLSSLSKPEPFGVKEKKSLDILPAALIFGRDSLEGRISGPYGTKTACFGWDNESVGIPTRYFYVQEFKKDDRGSSFLRLNNLNVAWAEDLLFRKMDSDSHIAGEAELARAGIEYIYADATNLYLCPERNFYSEVAQIDSFLRTKKPIITSEFGQIKKFEEEVFGQIYPDYETLSRLADYYGYIYTLDHSPQKEEFLARYLAIKGKLGSLNLILNNAALEVNGFRLMYPLTSARGDKDKVLQFAYTFRNFYGFFFFPFTPVVWRLGEDPKYISPTRVLGGTGVGGAYMRYREAILVYREEDLEKWRRASRRRIVEELTPGD